LVEIGRGGATRDPTRRVEEPWVGSREDGNAGSGAVGRNGRAERTAAREGYETAFHAFIHRAWESPLRGRFTLEYLREYERNAALSADELAALQWRKLTALVRHCWERVPFYRQHWAPVIDDPADIRSREDFARLPPLTREHLRDHLDGLHARDLRSPVIYRRTDGTTGEPVTVGFTPVDEERREALVLRGYRWAGYRLGARTLFLRGVPQVRRRGLEAAGDWLRQRLFNRRVIEATHLGDADLERHAAAIGQHRPEIIVGHVTPLYLLAGWLRDNTSAPHRVRAIVATGEPLAEFQRAEIARAFAAPVRNAYGCRELDLVAAEHARCGRLHVNADHLLVESAALDGATDPGPAQLLATDLANLAVPMVRYAVGDIGTLAPRPCTCGLPFPVIERVHGRRIDLLRTPSGRLVHVSVLAGLFLDGAMVRQYQVVQDAGERLRVRIVPGRDWTPAAAERLADGIVRAIGEPMPVSVSRVEQIPADRNGKFRIVDHGMAD
jgi:phenylacetate-CoA ligase